jgi:hypothetical protein
MLMGKCEHLSVIEVEVEVGLCFLSEYFLGILTSIGANR